MMRGMREGGMPVIFKKIVWIGRDNLMHTYNLDSVSRRGCDVPGALLTAGILVWPVRAAQRATGAVDLVFTLSWMHTHRNKQAHTKRNFQSWLHRKRSEEIERKEGEKQENQTREREVFKETHRGDKFGVDFMWTHTHVLHKHSAAVTLCMCTAIKRIYKALQLAWVL